jgi:TorA maturation chaperone TorD
MTGGRAAAAAAPARADARPHPAAETAAGRWELLRALGALAVGPPAATAGPAASLGLRRWSAAEHTRAFVLSLPPYASVYLGPEGKLGGEGADRVAGVWRAVGLAPPGDADHLAAILALYAELGEASQAAATRQARDRLAHLRTAVLWEQLCSWVPVYLDAIRGDPPFAPWADLLDRALRREAALSEPPAELPLALRRAPRGPAAGGGRRDLLDAVTAPVRAGFVLSHADLAAAARQSGTGLRRGERRFALAAMLEQDPAAALAWLGRHAKRWSGLHARRAAARPGAGRADPARWWARRAADAAAVLGRLAAAAQAARAGPGGR